MWKRFNFFDKALLAGPVLSKDDKELIQEQMRREGGAPMQDRDLSTGEEPEGPYRLLQAFDVICTGFARGRFYAGCHGGVAGIIENSGEPFKRWRAHVLRVTHVMPMAGSDIVATFGDGQDWRDTDVRSARRAMVVAARNHLAEANAWPPHGGPDGTGDTDPEAEGAAAGSVTADMEPMSAAVEAALARTAEVRPRLRIWRTSPAEASSSSSSSSAAAAAAVSAGSASSAAAAAAAAGVGASGFAALAASSASSSSSWPPVLLRDIPLDVDPDLCPAVTAVAVAEDLHSAAVGLANGAVILIRGDLSRPRGGSVAQVTILPPSAKFEPPAERRGAGHTGRAVTGLFFCRHSETSLDEPVPPGMADAEDSGAAAVAGSGRIQVLYVVTEQSCWSFFTGDSLPQSLRRMPTVTQLLRRRNFDRSPAAAAAVEDDGGDAEAGGDAGGGEGKGAPRPFRATPSAGGPRVLLSEEGAAAGCSCVAENGVLVIAGDGGIAPVTPQSRGPFFSLAGQKRGVSWARGRLVVVTSSGERQAVSVLDIRNQLAVLTMPLPLMQAQTAAALMGAGGGAGAGVAAGARHAPRTHAVTDILWGWSGVLLVVTTEGCVHCLWERSTADKLAALRAARRFDVAVRLARSSADFGPAAVAAIVREQGDVAYAEGRFREAAQRFAETIGFVEPSYVVRRFLAAPQTSNLVLYLEALHEKGHASAEHTTLLINCYTRAAAAAAAASGPAEAEAELSASDGEGGGGSDSSDSGGSDADFGGDGFDDDDEEDDDGDGEEDEDEAAVDGAGGSAGRGRAGAGGKPGGRRGRRGRGGRRSRTVGGASSRRGGRDADADGDGDAFHGSASARKLRVLAKLRSFIRSAKADPLDEEDDAGHASAGRDGGSGSGGGAGKGDAEGERAVAAAAGGGHGRRGAGQGSLDVSRAITELSQAGLPEFAAFALNLAVRSHRHEAAVGLWAGQLSDASAALRYLRALPHSVAERVTLRWGARLLRAMPSDTADVIKDLCTGWVPDVAAATETALVALDGDTADLAAWRARADAACASEARLQGRRDPRAPSTVRSHVGRFLPLFELPPEGLAAPSDAVALPADDSGGAAAGAGATAAAGAAAAGGGQSPPDFATAANAALLTGSADSRLRRLLDAQLRRLLSAVAGSASAPALSPAAALALLELSLRPDVGDPETQMLVPMLPPAAVAASSASSAQQASASKARTGGGSAPSGLASSVAAADGSASTALWRWVPRPGKRSAGSGAAALSRRVLAGVLENTSRCPVEADAALAMCRRFGFEDGSLRLMARAGSSGVRAAMERHVSLMEGATSARRWDDVVTARQALLDHCAAHQASDGSLWGEAMVAIVRCFVGRADTAEGSGGHAAGPGDDDAGDAGSGAGAVFLTGTDAEDEEEALSQCVEAAVTVGGMAPLQAVEILSQNSQVPLRVVKPLLERALGETERAAVEAEAATRAHRAETEVMRTELRQLRGPGVPFVAERSRFTGAELDGPSVHFLCGRVLAGRRLTADVDREHSFLRGEVDAFGDELVCPVCHGDHMHTLELRRQVAAAARDKARFFAVLDDPEERGGQFAAVAEFLGKGVVEPLTADLAPPART